jgi:hypothetical protein
MFNEAKLLGISLKKRSRRRLLVVSTFVLLAACIALISAQGVAEVRNLIFNFAFLVFIVVARGVFGAVVQQQLFPVKSGHLRGILPGLGLSRPVNTAEPGAGRTG